MSTLRKNTWKGSLPADLSDDAAHSEFSVFAYDTFTAALDAFQKSRHSHPATSAAWTLGAWAKRLQLSSSSPLSNILSGRKLPSRELGEALIQSMRLDELSNEYLYVLLEACVQTEASEVVRLGIYRRMQFLRTLAQRDSLSLRESEMITRQHVLAIRELAALPDFRPDPEWIQSRLRLKISSADCEAALTLLLKKGFIRQLDDGTFATGRGYYETPFDTPSRLIRQFHRESLDFAKDCLDLVKVEKRHVVSNLLCVRSEDLEKVKQRIEEFRKELNAQYDRTDRSADVLYQLNLQFLPLSHSPGQDEYE